MVMAPSTNGDIDNGSSDNCGVPSLSLSQTSFTCANLGANTVSLTATDGSGNTHSVDVTVTVVDSIDPVAVGQNFIVQLDGSGNASITPGDIDNGSGDNCSLAGLSVSPNTFTCANLGANTVTFTATDTSNNSHSVNVTVTVVDSINPVAVTQSFTAQLDASGNATITASDVDGGSSDNCAIVNRSLDVNSFTCNELGANTVTLTVTDASNNSNSAPATVTVVDSVNPTVVGQDITVEIDTSGSVSITAADVDGGSTDNCAVANLSIDVDTFTENEVGDNTVTLTVTDSSNNTASTTVTVTIVSGYHKTDVDQDGRISLSELLRVTQMYSWGGYECLDPGSTSYDGYTAEGLGNKNCLPHSADTNNNWLIEASELLRVIQLYTLIDFYPCPNEIPPTVDGFCIGTPGP